jgi:LysM repeat protein
MKLNQQNAQKERWPVWKRFNTLLFIALAFALGIGVTLFIQRSGMRQDPDAAQDLSALGEADNNGRVYNAPPPTNTRRAPISTASPTNGAMLVAQAATATETIPPYTGLLTLTPSRTLRPPPTLEPPTPTVPASLTPSTTPTPTTDIRVSIPGLRGAETATPSSTAGCTPRKEWKLEYEVKRDDALARIADTYNTTVDDLVEGNCLTDRNLIVIGQRLKVPGKAHPAQPEFACEPFEAITPRDGTLDIPGGGSISFVWRGPRVPYNLIRILDSNNNKVHEVVVELRQNESINIGEAVPNSGTYTWYIYPLNGSFVQACPEGGPYRFYKDQAPTATPTASTGGGGLGAP